jgi:hypothetical protein
MSSIIPKTLTFKAKMTTTNNTDNNNFKSVTLSSATLSDSYSCSYDKNAFYTENGMPFNKKKDSKSHGKKALDKAEAHKKKTDLRQKAREDEPVVFPLTYDGLMQWHQNDTKAKQSTEKDPVITNPGKIKKINVSNVLHNRKLSDPGNETQATLLKYYDDHILGEKDGCEEAFAAKQALEDEELAVKLALEAETEQCRLMFISENCSLETTKYQQGLAVKQEADRDILMWLASAPHQGLSLWQRYGLSEAQYIANQIYLADCALLDAYNYSYDDVTGLNPAQVQKLKARILAFEQQQILEQQAEAEADDANDWWIDGCFKQNDVEEDVEVVEDNIVEDDIVEEDMEEDMEQVDLDDWLENKREEDFESWRQNQIDNNA